MIPQELTKIYIRFIGERWSFISSAIRFETKSWCSHVELIRVLVSAMDGSERVVDVIGCRWPKGIQHYPYITKHVTQEQWWTGPNLEGAWQWMEDHKGMKYDLGAIWNIVVRGIFLTADFHNRKKMICSEAVLCASESTPTPWLNTWEPQWLVSPRDLTLSPLLKFEKRIR